MNRFVLIGGGSIQREETLEIDRQVVAMCKMKNPNLLFIGLTSRYADSYYDIVKKEYRKLGCIVGYLKKSNLINNRDLSMKKIADADIIYIGGGSTSKLLKRMKEYALDEVFKSIDNKIIVGMSAGAIMCCKSGFSDSFLLESEEGKFDFIEGFSLLPLNICPHYSNLLRKKSLQENLKKVNEKFWCLDDRIALKVEGEKINVIKSSKDALVRLCYYVDDEYREEVFYGLD